MLLQSSRACATELSENATEGLCRAICYSYTHQHQPHKQAQRTPATLCLVFWDR
jgi:hypothetical protein